MAYEVVLSVAGIEHEEALRGGYVEGVVAGIEQFADAQPALLVEQGVYLAGAGVQALYAAVQHSYQNVALFIFLYAVDVVFLQPAVCAGVLGDFAFVVADQAVLEGTQP